MCRCRAQAEWSLPTGVNTFLSLQNSHTFLSGTPDVLSVSFTSIKSTPYLTICDYSFSILTFNILSSYWCISLNSHWCAQLWLAAPSQETECAPNMTWPRVISGEKSICEEVNEDEDNWESNVVNNQIVPVVGGTNRAMPFTQLAYLWIVSSNQSESGLTSGCKVGAMLEWADGLQLEYAALECADSNNNYQHCDAHGFAARSHRGDVKRQ